MLLADPRTPEPDLDEPEDHPRPEDVRDEWDSDWAYDYERDMEER